MSESNGFNEWKNHILAELDRLATETKDFHSIVHKHIEQQAKDYAKLSGQIKTQDARIKVWSSLIALIVATLVTMGFKFIA